MDTARDGADRLVEHANRQRAAARSGQQLPGQVFIRFLGECPLLMIFHLFNIPVSINRKAQNSEAEISRSLKS